MARVRVLNIWNLSGGPLDDPPNPFPGAWDLETDLEPRFAPRSIIPLLEMSPFVPPISLPRGWSVSMEQTIFRPSQVGKYQFAADRKLS